MQGVRNAVPSAKVLYARGVDLVEGRQDPRAVPPIPSQFLRPAAGSTEQGLKGEYFKGKELQGAAGGDAHRSRASTSAGIG